MRVPQRVLLLLALAMSVLLAACGGSSGSSSSQEHAGGHSDEEAVMEPVEGAEEIDVTAVDIDFQPDTLELTAGEPVNVNVTNKGDAEHDFTLEEAGVHLNVPSGESKTTAVTVDEPGTYQALCTVPGHADAGMTIEVTVSE